MHAALMDGGQQADDGDQNDPGQPQEKTPAPVVLVRAAQGHFHRDVGTIPPDGENVKEREKKIEKPVSARGPTECLLPCRDGLSATADANRRQVVNRPPR
jgi:hypothetical protein